MKPTYKQVTKTRYIEQISQLAEEIFVQHYTKLTPKVARALAEKYQSDILTDDEIHSGTVNYFMIYLGSDPVGYFALDLTPTGAMCLSRLFLLEMGEPVRIMDLARQMIALSGHVPGKDIEIEVTGLRPGEKLTELLLDETERSLPCAPKVMEVVSSSALRITANHLIELEAMAQRGDVDQVRAKLFDIVAQVRGEKPSTPALRVVSSA